MNKEQLVAATARRIKESKDAEHTYAQWEIEFILPHILDTISETLAEGKEVKLQGFGRFSIKTVKAHSARNPRTKESVWVPEKKKIVFLQTPHFKFNETESAEAECTLTDSDTTQQDE